MHDSPESLTVSMQIWAYSKESSQTRPSVPGYEKMFRCECEFQDQTGSYIKQFVV